MTAQLKLIAMGGDTQDIDSGELSIKDMFTAETLESAAQDALVAAWDIAECGVRGRDDLAHLDKLRLDRAMTAVTGDLFEALRGNPDPRVEAAVALISTWREVVHYSAKVRDARQVGGIDLVAMEAEGIFRAKAAAQIPVIRGVRVNRK